MTNRLQTLLPLLGLLALTPAAIGQGSGGATLDFNAHATADGTALMPDALRVQASAADGTSYSAVWLVANPLTAQEQAGIVADHMESQLWDVDVTAGVLTVHGRWDEVGDYVQLGGFVPPSLAAATYAEYEAATETAAGGPGVLNLKPLVGRTADGQPDPDGYIYASWVRVRIVADDGTVFDRWVLIPFPYTPTELATFIARLLAADGWVVHQDGSNLTIDGHKGADGSVSPVSKIGGYTFGPADPDPTNPRHYGPIPSVGGHDGVTSIIPPGTPKADLPKVIKKNFPNKPVPKQNQ